MAMTDKTAEDYELFHYGIKGMKWGKRKSQVSDAASSAVAKAKSKIPEVSDDNKRRLKTAGKVAAGAAVIAGTAAVSSVLSRKGMISVSDSNKFAASTAMNIGAQFVKNNTDYQVLNTLVGHVSGNHTSLRLRQG